MTDYFKDGQDDKKYKDFYLFHNFLFLPFLGYLCVRLKLFSTTFELGVVF